jgi:hypothetical protein
MCLAQSWSMMLLNVGHIDEEENESASLQERTQRSQLFEPGHQSTKTRFFFIQGR